jgi:hypothetical protein
MGSLVFVEGLWHTGKSHFINRAKELSQSSDRVAIFDNLRSLGSVRHSSYLIYPQLIKNKNQMFDRSPVTLKVISNKELGLYYNELVTPEYWNIYYDEWINFLKTTNKKIIFIYFRPFHPYKNLLQEEILNYVIGYSKYHLMVDKRLITVNKLIETHELFCQEINNLYKELKSRFTFYQVEYQDTEEALDILKYEKFLPSLGDYIENSD